MALLEVFPPTNTVEKFVRYFVDLGEPGRWRYFAGQALLLYVLLFLTLYIFSERSVSSSTALKRRSLSRLISGNLVFVIFLVAFILVSRLPSVCEGFLNPDEANWIAFAKTLAYDPRYWVSADGGTGGPLVPFSLLILKIFGLPIDFGSLKIMSGGIMAVSVSLLFLSFSRVMGPCIARLVILPLAVAVSVMRNGDLIAYNSEHLAIILLCLAFFFLARLYDLGPGNYNLNLISLGITLGAAPLAKLQGAPIAFVVGLFACVVILMKLPRKCLFILILCALAPTNVILLAVWSYGGLNDFWTSYITFNLAYTSQGVEKNFAEYMINLFYLIFLPVELGFFIRSSLAIVLMGLFLILALGEKVSKKNVVMILFSIILLCVSCFSIVTPSRPFPHYMLLFLIPMTVLVAAIVYSVSDVASRYRKGEGTYNHPVLRLTLATIFLFITTFYYFQIQFSFTPDLMERAKMHYNGYVHRGDVVAILNRYFSPGARMAIWGWGTELWVGTDFLMGTRDAATAVQIEPGPLQGYYQKRYLDDLEKNRPVLFVDAVGPGFFSYDNRSTQGFENFPALKEYILNGYSWEAEIGNARIYLRKDANIVAKSFVTRALNTRPSAGEFPMRLDEISRNGSFIQFQGWTIVRNNTKNQKVMLALVNESDTILLRSYQTANKSVVDSSPNNKYNLMCGYYGLIPAREIPAGDYQIGLYATNENVAGFKLLNRSFNLETYFQKP